MRGVFAAAVHCRAMMESLPSSGPAGHLPPRGKAFVKGTALRTKRTLLNMAYALGSSLLLLLLGLITRRLLVDNFGPQITTASQVVSQLFNFFSIAEFGVGSVISYRLYEQIAAKNEEKISKYMSMYKWAYRVVGMVIAGLALLGAVTLRCVRLVSPEAPGWRKKCSAGTPFSQGRSLWAAAHILLAPSLPFAIITIHAQRAYCFLAFISDYSIVRPFVNGFSQKSRVTAPRCGGYC